MATLCKSLNTFWTICTYFSCLCGLAPSSSFCDIYEDVKAIVFDCNGVLVDTEYLKFLAWQEALASHIIDLSIEEYMPLLGSSSKNILLAIERSKGLKIPVSVIEKKNEVYKVLQERGVPPIQMMIDFARDLAENKKHLGFKLGLASSESKKEILESLRQIGLENAFDVIISAADDLDGYTDEEGKSKPKPYIYIEAAKQLGIRPSQCIVFEDTTVGVTAALAAGMIAIAVPNQFTLHQNFSKAARTFYSHEDLSGMYARLYFNHRK